VREEPQPAAPEAEDESSAPIVDDLPPSSQPDSTTDAAPIIDDLPPSSQPDGSDAAPIIDDLPPSSQPDNIDLVPVLDDPYEVDDHPGTTPADNRSTEAVPDTRATLEPGGLLRFSVPAAARVLHLQFRADDQRCFITADRLNPGQECLVTRDEAVAAVANGQVFFQLPDAFDTQDGYWRASPGMMFEDGLLSNLEEISERSHEVPLELRLEVKWQYFKFEFFDRWTSSLTCVPQPRSTNAEGVSTAPPLVLEGSTWSPQSLVNLKRTECSGAWDLSVGQDTIHCLGWVRRKVDRARAQVRQLPDADCLVRFHNDQRLFVRTDGDGDHAGARRDFVTFPPDDSAATAPSADRLRLYDLPADWWSTNFPVRVGDEPIDKLRPFKNVVSMPSARDKPYVVSLDTVVLTHGLSQEPERDVVWDDSKIERRFAIYDNKLGVHLADTTSGEIYFTSLARLQKKPDGPVLYDMPGFTRMIAQGRRLYFVFDQRTPRHPNCLGFPIGARAAVRDAFADPFATVEFDYLAPAAHGSSESDSSGSAGAAALLRCCGRDGAVEEFFLLQFMNALFNFSPAPDPRGRFTLLTRPPSPEDARIQVRDCLLDVVRRWNGGDDLNGAPVYFEVGSPMTARGRYALLLPGGVDVSQRSPEPGELRINVYDTGRSNQGGPVGSWTIDALTVDRHGWFTAAHEVGHALSLPDEYLNGDYEPSLGAPHIAESYRSPGTIYGSDRSSIMVENRKPRARHYWHLVLWAREKGCFSGVQEVAVRHGQAKFTAALTDRKASCVQFPRLQVLDAPVGPLGICDQFVYLTGRDEWTGRELGGASAERPFDGVISVRVKVVWDFAERSDFDDMSGLVGRAHQIVDTAFNRKLNLTVNAVLEGAPVRLRVLFAFRSLCRTSPTGPGASQYLEKDIRYPFLKPPDAVGYAERVKDLIQKHGVHAEITVADGKTVGLVPGTPRRAVVRDGVLLHFFESRSFDEDVLKVFCELLGLPPDRGIEARDFLPLLEPLRSRLGGVAPELIVR
jgi:hypothetical protein